MHLNQRLSTRLTVGDGFLQCNNYWCRWEVCLIKALLISMAKSGHFFSSSCLGKLISTFWHLLHALWLWKKINSFLYIFLFLFYYFCFVFFLNKKKTHPYCSLNSGWRFSIYTSFNPHPSKIFLPLHQVTLTLIVLMLLKQKLVIKTCPFSSRDN